MESIPPLVKKKIKFERDEDDIMYFGDYRINANRYFCFQTCQCLHPYKKKNFDGTTASGLISSDKLYSILLYYFGDEIYTDKKYWLGCEYEDCDRRKAFGLPVGPYNVQIRVPFIKDSKGIQQLHEELSKKNRK